MARWKLWKRWRIEPYEFIAFAIIVCIVVSRIILIAFNWPRSDSDEGTMALEAMHIAFRGAHPVFFYGQNYMGTLEAYFGAFFMHLFGASLFTFRLGMVLIVTLFLIAFYFMARLLYTKGLAVVALILVGLGSDTVIERELKAVGGGVETLLFGTLSIVLAVWLAFTAGQEQRQQKRWPRRLAYFGWGVVVGLGLWSHFLVAPFLLAGGLILLVFCWREWRTWAIPCLLAGLIIGGIPLLYYNLTAPLSQNSLAVALSIVGGSNPGSGVYVGHVKFIQHIVGTFDYGLPLSTFFPSVCNLNVLPFYGRVGSTTLTCSIEQGGWSLFYMSLLLISMAMAIVSLWQLARSHRARQETWSEEQRQAEVIHFGRLMLLFAGLLTILFYLASNLTAAKPNDVRYLIGLSIILPGLIWPLWYGIRPRSDVTWGRFLSMVTRYSILALIGVVLLTGTVITFTEIPSTEAAYTNDHNLIQVLEQRGITRFYSEYWTCDRLVFFSQEHLICGVVNPHDSKPGLNRIPSYFSIVAADPNAPYIFPAGLDTNDANHNPLLEKHYHHFELDNFTIYLPDK